MSVVKVHEAKAQLSRLIEDALSGEEVIIARRNKPLVRLVPVEQEQSSRVIGSARGRIVIAPDFDETPEEFGEYL